MILIDRDISSHWYMPTGEPFYEVPRADGQGVRPATLKDARKVNALPSVTNIISVVDKPGLGAWKQEQAIMSALTLPRNDEELLDSFARRIVVDMQLTTKRAADIGSSVHSGIEGFLMHGKLPEDNHIRRLIEPFVSIHKLFNIKSCEVVYVHKQQGYAGRIDLVAEYNGKLCIFDIKTQKYKKGKPVFYETWPLQLEAYRQAVIATDSFMQVEGIGSIVLNSEKPEPAIIKLWDDHSKYWSAFQNAIHLWQYIKDYKP